MLLDGWAVFGFDDPWFLGFLLRPAKGFSPLRPWPLEVASFEKET